MSGTFIRIIFRIIFFVTKSIFRWPVFLAYKAYVRFSRQMDERGIAIKNPFLYFFSAKIIIHLLFIGMGCAVILNDITTDASESFALAPRNLLVYYIIPEDEAYVEEQALIPQQQTYAPLEGIRSESESLAPNAPVSFTAPGDIAMGSGALIKPTIPTTLQGASTPNALRTYVVQSGDTIAAIATKFNLNQTTILWANDLRATSILSIGQKLMILPVDGVLHRVKRGDTIDRIALIYNAESSKVLAFNNIPPNGSIAIGDALIIPNGIIKAVPVRQNNSLIARLKNIITPTPSIPQAVKGALNFLWPTTASRITQYYSWRHTGVDIAGPPSNKIFASASGTVIISGWQRGYGYTIVIDHNNGYRTRYGHASKLFVSSGAHVERGEIIAMVGSTGRSTGPHVHFEIVRNGSRVNPLQYVR